MHISHRAGTIEMEGKLAPSLPCRVCGKQVSGPDRQTHMGRHIYLALHVGHDDSATKSSVSDKVMNMYLLLIDAPFRCQNPIRADFVVAHHKQSCKTAALLRLAREKPPLRHASQLTPS